MRNDPPNETSYHKNSQSELEIPDGGCIRLYGQDGMHRLSILACCSDDDHYDLATPEGKVLWCSKRDSSDWKVFSGFPVGKIEEHFPQVDIVE